MGRKFIAADLHIGYDWTPEQYGRIWKFQAMLEPDDLVVYDGDTHELVWLTKDELFNSKIYHKFIKGTRCETVYVRGNHDIDIGLESFIIGDTLIKHGHQWDIIADSAWKRFYYRFAPYLRNIWWQTPFEQRINRSNEWMLHVASIYFGAVKWLETGPCGMVVIGHTHDTCVIRRPVPCRRLVGVGSLPENGTYGEFTDKGIVIRKIDNQEIVEEVKYITQEDYGQEEVLPRM